MAIAALGSSFAYAAKALSQVKLTHILVTLAGLLFIVLLPGVIAGFIKIRKRDMSVLLEALGLAVNVRMRLSHTLGELFTHTPPLPKGSRRDRNDTLEHFLKRLGYASLSLRRIAVLVFIAVLIVLALMLAMTACPRWMSLFYR